MAAWLIAALILVGGAALLAESAGFGRFQSEAGEVLPLGPEDIAAVGLQAGDGADAIHLELTDDAARAFGALTERTVGQRLALVICDETILDVVVQAPIRSGRVLIDGVTPEAARRLGAVLSGAAPCP